MSTIINTYSYSFIYDLEEFFSLDKKNIKNFFSKNLPDILNKNDEIKKNVNNCKELKTFLAKKRNLKLDEEDFIQNKKHFKNSVTADNAKDILINSGSNENIYIEKKLFKLYIYKNPIILMQLFDCRSINFDLINDNLSLFGKMEKIKKFKYKIYSVDNKTNKLNITNQLELPTLYDKSIKFENENIYPYLLVTNNQIQEIKDSDLLFENIYKTNEEKNGLISPADISSIFFYYFNISKEFQNTYNYIETENRKKLYYILSQFLNFSSKKITIIVGPKGIGKSTTLIKFSFQKEFRIFYFNLETFQINSEDIKKKELKLQLNKLFRIIEQEKNNKEKNNEEQYRNIKKEIENYLDKNIYKSGIEIIYNIINIFQNFAKDAIGINFGFIIDQYSSNYHKNIEEYNLNMIFNLINESKNIKLILCPTINNLFSKEQINTIFYSSLQTDHNYFNIYYFQEFISQEEFFKNILVDEKDEYKDIFDELGYLPKHFYDLKNIDLDIYKNYLATNLNNNIKEYYLSNNKKNDETNMNIEILKLLDLVKGEKLISSSEFYNNITNLPLKYLKITKYIINNNIIKDLSDKFREYYKINKIKKEKEEEEILIKYLSLLWNNEENNKYDDIISKNFFIEERNIYELINENYFEKDKRSMNIYGNYYKTFIDNYNNYFDPFIHEYDNIYVYKLEFSFNFIENIFLKYLCDHIKQENLFFSKILDRGACGGIYELLLGYYIQTDGSFFGINIEKTIYVSSLVPSNYSIIYYSSYNKKRNFFKEFTLDIKEKKRKIQFKNTFIKQTIFNSKYYDMAILIKSDKDNTYKLLAIQASIMKDEEKRLTKDEHELILRSVKLNLENEFDIFIEEASFIYVLSKKNGIIEDQETQKNCDINNIEYIGFDINDLENNNNKYKINFDKAFITKLFPIHNAASLLSFSNKSDELKYLELKAVIDENIRLSKELKDYHIYINNLFKNKYGNMEISSKYFCYFELKYPIFDKNKNILNFLSDFSFLIFIENNSQNIYIHFDKSTYNCNENFNKFTFKPIKKNIDQILFCYSSIPLAIKNVAKK